MELVDDVCVSLVEVHRPRMALREGAGLVDGTEERSRGLHDLEGRASGRPDVDAACRRASPGPHQPPLAEIEPTVGDELGEELFEFGSEDRGVLGDQGKLVGCTRDLALEDGRVRRVDDRSLRRPGEQVFGMVHEVLVECVLARDQHRQ